MRRIFLLTLLITCATSFNLLPLIPLIKKSPSSLSSPRSHPRLQHAVHSPTSEHSASLSSTSLLAAPIAAGTGMFSRELLKPLFINCVSGIMLAAAADLLAQVMKIDFTSDVKVFENPYLMAFKTKRERFSKWVSNFRTNMGTVDLTRMAGFALFGLAVKGFIQFYYYGFFIDKITNGNCILSTMFDQLIYVPALYYPLYFTCTGLFQGRSIRESLSYYKSSFVNLCLASIVFWTPIQILNFKLIPVLWRNIVVLFSAFVWTLLLSLNADPAKDE
ncbi:hypothetical protein TrST_g10606 [Triparma strigata]|uniref:Uncharacterized protein n=2 Tax=Triparma TaxID=722752 RepID=A0A9W7EHE1_9STRA|nr:hypothetical protein TrST_g10606 [Triparma strigata]